MANGWAQILRCFGGLLCLMGGFKNKQVWLQNEDTPAQPPSRIGYSSQIKEDRAARIPKVYTIREYEMTREQRAQYRSMEQEFVLWMNQDEYVTVDAAITKYTKLAQIQ